jgi:hypothetical protein
MNDLLAEMHTGAKRVGQEPGTESKRGVCRWAVWRQVLQQSGRPTEGVHHGHRAPIRVAARCELSRTFRNCFARVPGEDGLFTFRGCLAESVRVRCQWAPKTRQRWARQNQPLEAKA